ncbi:hypothetical protein BDZ45DRAFT_460382 [Acephala macrosclerotiorum]|nr:hypothetical protein BDZ45DRAFT_460382 [Acephala macrosclerotiorum]
MHGVQQSRRRGSWFWGEGVCCGEEFGDGWVEVVGWRGRVCRDFVGLTMSVAVLKIVMLGSGYGVREISRQVY